MTKVPRPPLSRVPGPAPAGGEATRAKKSLAQHFLVDRTVLGRLLRAADLTPADVVVEVGPGRGVLTRALAARVGRLVAIEMDEALASALAAEFVGRPEVTVVAGDAREVDLAALLGPAAEYKVVANLPYYAASPIVRRFLSSALRPRLMVVMVQKEVAQTMAAPAGKASLLTVAVQLYGRPRIVAYVPPSAFRPKPKVASAIVRIDVYPEPAVAFDSEERFFDLVRAAFSAPRKQVRNSLRVGMPSLGEAAATLLAEAGIEPRRRAETLTLAEWGRLYGAYRQFVT